MFIYSILRLISNATVELDDVFEWEELPRDAKNATTAKTAKTQKRLKQLATPKKRFYPYLTVPGSQIIKHPSCRVPRCVHGWTLHSRTVDPAVTRGPRLHSGYTDARHAHATRRRWLGINTLPPVHFMPNIWRCCCAMSSGRTTGRAARASSPPSRRSQGHGAAAAE
jgi:hypothetical protein